MTDFETKILLEIKDQVGMVSRETGMQTQKLFAIEDQVKKTNGRTTKNETEIQDLKDINTLRKGRSAVIGAITGSITTIIVAVIIALITGIAKKIFNI